MKNLSGKGQRKVLIRQNLLRVQVAQMKFAEVTYPLRKFDDIYYTIERIVYGRGNLKGFTSEDIYDNLRDKRFFRDAPDLNRYLMENARKYKIRKINGAWERYW
jgi:hypothetical protein